MEPFQLDHQLIADFVDGEVSPLQALWARVHAEAARLDPEAAAYDNEIRKLNPKHQNGFMATSQKVIWLTSLKNPARGIRAGRTISAPPLLAAQMIVGGTHREATGEEIKAWHKEQQARKERVAELEKIKNPPAPAPVTEVHISAEVIRQAMNSANAGAQPNVAPPPPPSPHGKGQGGANKSNAEA